jgi:hypothetical protein
VPTCKSSDKPFSFQTNFDGFYRINKSILLSLWAALRLSNKIECEMPQSQQLPERSANNTFHIISLKYAPFKAWTAEYFYVKNLRLHLRVVVGENHIAQKRSYISPRPS